MFVWRGYGATVAIVGVASALTANLIADKVGGPHYWDTHGWPLAASFFVDGVVLWAIDDALARKPARILVDEATGERVAINKYHDFFFIRIRWWALILASLGVAILLTGWSPGPG